MRYTSFGFQYRHTVMKGLGVMMKKFVCFVLVALLSTVTLTSCLIEDAYGLYTTVMDSMEDASAFEGDFEVKANVTAGGMSVGMTFDGNMQYIEHSETDIDMALNLHMNLGALLGGENGEQAMSMYYKDGWQYTNSAGSKVKTEMPLDELLGEEDISKNEAFEFVKIDPGMIVDSETTRIDGGKKIFFELDGEKVLSSILERYEEAFDTELDLGSLGNLLGGVAGEDIDLSVGNIQYTLLVDKNNILYGASVICTIKMGEDYAVEVAFNVSDLAFDSFTEIDMPDDLDEYAELGSWITDPEDYSSFGENYFDDYYDDYYYDDDLYGNMIY